MNIAFTVLTMLFAEQQLDFHEMILAMVKWTLRGVLSFISLLTSPLVWLQSLKSRKRCPPVRNNLLLLSATELGKRLRALEISSEDIVSAYITRCKEVNPIVNAIVETRFEVAMQEAKEADVLLRSGKKSMDEIEREMPLLGIPVTVKESIAVKGMSHAAGRKMAQKRIASEDGDSVHRVREAGGIVIVVSNTPEYCINWETTNNVTGTTVNPYDSRRTAGGSSGGEAALLGSAASILSLSSDIGGSARLPAMFCGVFGHKPTPGFVSTNGHLPDCDDKEWPNFFTIGPMVRYAEDLPLILKTMSQTDVKLDTKVSFNNMKFFYIEECGSELASSVDGEIINGIRNVVDHFGSRHGSTVQKTEIKDLKYSVEVAATILLGLEADSVFMKGTDRGEWKSVFVEIMRYLCLMSPHTLGNMCYGILKRTQEKLPKSFHDKMMEKNASLKQQFKDLLGDNNVLIYPTITSASHYLNQVYLKAGNMAYMMIFNALGLPVTQCPIGLNKNGLPIGIQIVANPGCDYLTIAVAREIEKAFGGWQPPTASENPV